MPKMKFSIDKCVYREIFNKTIANNSVDMGKTVNDILDTYDENAYATLEHWDPDPEQMRVTFDITSKTYFNLVEEQSKHNHNISIGCILRDWFYKQY